MPTFDIIKEVKPSKTFRVASVIGKFDLQSENVVEHFKGDIDIPNKWQVGLIVGKSGTGKTTIAKQLFEDAYITSYEYTAETVLDDMPKDCSVEEITAAFNSIGFSSPPSLINALKKSNQWACKYLGRLVAKTGILHGNNDSNNNSKQRITASFELK
jgi:Cdc6-like AAA superfamily ATPase